MKKYFKIMLITLCLLTIMTGCSDKDMKSVLSGDNFKSIMNDNGYTVYDYSDEYDYAESAYISVGNDYKIMFVDATRRSDIEGVFLDECRNFAKSADEDGTDDIIKGDNYEIYTISDDDTYYYIELVGNTYLYVKSDLDLKDDMDSLIEELGY